MHFTGYVFNDYARMRSILEWIATQIPAERGLVFISAWDGRYYWDYPTYRAAERLGGEAGVRGLGEGAHRRGLLAVPVLGAHGGHRGRPDLGQVAGAACQRGLG